MMHAAQETVDHGVDTAMTDLIEEGGRRGASKVRSTDTVVPVYIGSRAEVISLNSLEVSPCAREFPFGPCEFTNSSYAYTVAM